MNETSGRLLSLSEAARRAGVTRSALLHAHRRGRLALVWFGPVRAVDEAELDRYLRERKRRRGSATSEQEGDMTEAT